MEVLLGYDRILFHLINVTLNNKIFDSLMPFITERDHWILLYIFLWLFLVIKGGKPGRIAAILVLFAVLATDQISASIIKPMVGRLRPCQELEGVRLLVGCGGKFGFPSSHAANYFGVATVLAFYFPKYKSIYILVSILIAYSRVYVGVHYPIDVLVGALLGIACGVILVSIYQSFEKLITKMKKSEIPVQG
jgi:undecaprenyl-diphosphatase